ncbi:ubiquitin carboxyl-terminal hydrolase 7-like [Brachionus plicatilis]|uniref:Ubiquitin carboxyl-terminal hydrolase 7-like n=1 Tax=Brachionus plicatilis TaxID=10195 RepID=A0A3M7SUJ8_BRAPC|nr:ubiquitin carboxyl-terminal hydrolase 7-like [Brachionus plicatilis]
MDDISISLPCGFSAKYNEIYNSNAKFPCPVCNSHNLMRQECLDMTRNKLVINELHLNQKKNIFQQCLKNIEICKSDPQSSIDESYQNLKNQLDIRREEIKLIVVKKIDDYYEDLFKIMEEENEKKLNEFETRIRQIPSLEKEIMDFQIQDTTEITKKMEIIDGFCAKIENGITFLNKVKDDLETNKWIFNPGDESLDIKGLFGKLDCKEETKVIQKTDHLNKMDNASIILPCGFPAKYNEIYHKSAKLPVRKSHNAMRQECLDMTRNKLLINEINLNIKKKKYDELMQELKFYKNDPKHFINRSFDILKDEIIENRSRFEEMMEVYHEYLFRDIEIKRDIKLKDIEEIIKQAEAFDLTSLNVDKNLDIYSKLDFYEKNNIKIDIGIGLFRNVLENLKEPKLKLSYSSNLTGFDELFAELYSAEETSIILNKNEVDDDSRSEATIKFKINDFFLLKKKNVILRSKKCFVRNFEWHISIKLNEKDGEMGFFLNCNSTAKSNKFPVNVTAELSLLNKFDSSKDLKKNFEHSFGVTRSYGFSKFTTISETMNPKNGFYTDVEGFIILKAIVKVKLPQRIFK